MKAIAIHSVTTPAQVPKEGELYDVGATAEAM